MSKLTRLMFRDHVRRCQRNIRGVPPDARFEFRLDVRFKSLLVSFRKTIFVRDPWFRGLVQDPMVYLMEWW